MCAVEYKFDLKTAEGSTHILAESIPICWLQKNIIATLCICCATGPHSYLISVLLCIATSAPVRKIDACARL